MHTHVYCNALINSVSYFSFFLTALFFFFFIYLWTLKLNNMIILGESQFYLSNFKLQKEREKERINRDCK